MALRHLIAATSDTEAGEAALQSATTLGRLFNAKVTVLGVANEPLGERAHALMTGALRERVARHLPAGSRPLKDVDVAVRFGLPGVEIGRFAEAAGADLVIMGRDEAMVGPEAVTSEGVDSVARRSRVPCLFVSAGCDRFQQVLVALDGTDRGLVVLDGAIEFARGTGARVRALTVEAAIDEIHSSLGQSARTDRLAEAIGRIRRKGPLKPEQWQANTAHHSDPVVVRHGNIVDEVLSEVGAGPTDVLVFGCHRGGPSVSGHGLNIARQLMQRSAASLLTIPL